MANSCKYYTEKTLAWMLDNKLIVFLSLLSFSLFVSTWALAAQKNRALSRIDDLNAQLATTTTTTTTLAPVPNPEEPGTGESGGDGESSGTREGDGNGAAGGNGANNETGGSGSGGTGDSGSGNTGTGLKSRKSNAAIRENEGADQEKMEDALENENINDSYDNVENESGLQSIVQNSKLLAALVA